MSSINVNLWRCMCLAAQQATNIGPSAFVDGHYRDCKAAPVLIPVHTPRSVVFEVALGDSLLRNHLLYRCTAKGAKAKAAAPAEAIQEVQKCLHPKCDKPAASTKARYCGRLCRRKMERLKERTAREQKACAGPGCQKRFSPRNSDCLYCSPACSNAAKNARRRGRAVTPMGPLERRTCALEGCEVEFEVPRNNPAKAFCCSEHWSKGRGKDSIVSEEEREHLHMGHIRLREAEVRLEAWRAANALEEARERSYALWFSLLPPTGRPQQTTEAA